MNITEGAYLPSMFLLNFVPEEFRDVFVHFDVTNNFEKNIALGNCVCLANELLENLFKSK